MSETARLCLVLEICPQILHAWIKSLVSSKCFFLLKPNNRKIQMIYYLKLYLKWRENNNHKCFLVWMLLLMRSLQLFQNQLECNQVKVRCWNYIWTNLQELKTKWKYNLSDLLVMNITITSSNVFVKSLKAIISYCCLKLIGLWSKCPSTHQNLAFFNIFAE